MFVTVMFYTGIAVQTVRAEVLRLRVRHIPADLVRKARDKVFHLKCFTCFVCSKQLLTGEELYVVDDCKFVCKDDYQHRPQHQLNDSLYEDEEELDEDAGEGEEGWEGSTGPAKLGTEANNNSLLGLSPRLSPASALDKAVNINLDDECAKMI